MNDTTPLDPDSEFEIPADNVVSIGDAAAAVVGKVKPRKAGPKDLPTRPPRVVEKGKTRRKKKVEAGEEGHNSQALDQDRLKLAFIGDITAIDIDLNSTIARRRNRCKQAKADGLKVSAILKAMKEAKLGRDELIERINDENEARDLLSIPASPQMPLEATVQDQKGREALAEKRGRADAFRSLSESQCPFSDPGTGEYQSWLRGFREAKALFTEACKPSVITKIQADAKKHAQSAASTGS